MFNTQTHTWHEHTGTPTPGERYGAMAVAHGNAMYLHGGGRGFPLHLYDDVWRFDLQSGWQHIPMLSGPTARYYHGLAIVDSPPHSSPTMVLFGGANCSGACVCHGDTWTLDLAAVEKAVADAGEKHVLNKRKKAHHPVHIAELPSFQWTRISTELSTRYHHTLVAYGNTVYTFGGESYSPLYMYHNSVTALTLAGASAGGGAGAGIDAEVNVGMHAAAGAAVVVIALVVALLRKKLFASSSSKLKKRAQE